MTDRDALLAAVHAQPLDDAPRLVLADWLDEHGQPERAEFIRLQVAQRREFETHGRTARLDDLFVQARSLFYRPWAEPVRKVFGRGIGMYSRGFPKGPGYPIPADVLVTHLPAAATWIAPETEIAIEARPGQSKLLAVIPEVRWVRHLSVRWPWRSEPPVEEAEITDLLASPHLTGLRRLTLAHLGLTAETARAIRNAPALRSLDSLDLSGNQLGRTGGLELARGRHLTALRHLDLSGNRIGNVAVQALLKSAALSGLRSLNVSGTRLTPAVARLLEERFPAGPEGTPSE